MQLQPTDEKQRIGKALGRVPSGVFILTACAGDRRMAMLASWIQQASFEPPALSIAVGKDRPIVELIRAHRHLAVSVVPENDTTLMKRYARGLKAGEDPFHDVRTIETPGGQIALADALAWMEGELIGEAEFAADHVLLIANVTAGSLLRDGGSFTHLRGSGFHY